MPKSLFGPLDGFVESFVKNVLCETIQPVRGSILKIDLEGGFLKSSCHTGIYVGNNRIVEMTNEDGKGIIRKVPPKYFLNFSLHRTGVFIYIACGKKNGKYYPLGSEDIAERAEQAVGEATDYNLLLDNCHLFTERCIAGEKDSWFGTLDGVESALIQKFNPPAEEILIKQSPLIHTTFPSAERFEKIHIHWMSTGVSSNDLFKE